MAAISTLGGVWLTQAGERDRRSHETKVRALDREHEHRERLYADRLQAYHEFSAAFMEYDRRYDDLENVWGHRRMLSEEIPKTQGEEAQKALTARLDASQQSLSVALEICFQCFLGNPVKANTSPAASANSSAAAGNRSVSC